MTQFTSTPNSTTKRVTSILAAERARGYRDGLGTINQVAVDEAHQEGCEEGLRLGERGKRDWGIFCFACGVGVSALFYGLVLA